MKAGRKKNLIRAIAVITALACLVCTASVLFACQNEKYDAFIEAGSVQRVAYDGQVHYPVARLNHNETALSYSGGDVGYGGCREPGEYLITISAAETENYKAVSTTVTLIIENQELNGDVFEQMIDRMVESGDFDLNEKIAVDLELDLNFYSQQQGADWKYTLKIKGNIDFTDPAATALYIGLYDANAQADVAAISYDGANSLLYLTMEGQNYKIENADLINALISASAADGENGIDTAKLSEHIKQAAATVLASGEVSADGDVFTFNFHMDNLFTSTVAAVAEAFMPGVGEQMGRLLYGMLKEDIWSGSSVNLPGISGILDIKFNGNKFAGIELRNLEYADQEEAGVFLPNVKSSAMGNNVTVNTSGLLPADTSGYSSSKLLNVSASGSVDIMQGEAERGELGWSLDVNMDLAQFIISGGDFSDPALQDNMFHLSLWYNPAAQVSSAWASSGDRAEALASAANIADIVFDPKNTGTSMVYVSFAPLTLMNDNVISLINGISNNQYTTLRGIFRDYSMIQLDINAVVSSMAFRQGETSEAFDALGGAIGFLSRLMAIVDISGGMGVSNISDLANVLDGDFGDDPFLMGFSLGDFITAMFSVNAAPADTLRLNVGEYELFGTSTTEHNAVQSGLVNNFDGSAKTYLDHYASNKIDDTPVMTPHIRQYEGEDGRAYISLYTQSLPNGVQYTVYDKGGAAYSDLSAGEMAAIDEFAIGYTYTDIYGNANENIYTARIIRVEGYDPNVTGPQYVTFYTEPIEGYNILTNFDNLLRATSEHKISFEGYRVSGWIDVNAQIQSVRGKAAYGANANVTDEFSGGENVTQIAVGREVGSSSQYYASQLYEVEITYTDGSVKTVGIDAEMDEFAFSNPSIVEYEYQTRYSILGGGFTKRWVAKAVGETDMTLSTPLGDLVWRVQITENTI